MNIHQTVRYPVTAEGTRITAPRRRCRTGRPLCRGSLRWRSRPWRAYAASRFMGYDLSVEAVEQAQQEARDYAVSNVYFEVPGRHAAEAEEGDASSVVSYLDGACPVSNTTTTTCRQGFVLVAHCSKPNHNGWSGELPVSLVRRWKLGSCIERRLHRALMAAIRAVRVLPGRSWHPRLYPAAPGWRRRRRLNAPRGGHGRGGVRPAARTG